MSPDAADELQTAQPPPAPTESAPGPRSVQRLRADIMGHDTVPSAPRILFEILALLDDDGDMRRLSTLIARDPGLTAKILRAANSSFFAQSRTVGTVDRAVLVLGESMVRSLAVSVAVFDAVGGSLPASQVEAVWRHSLATAMAARLLCARTGAGDRDEAFTAGLLHEAGHMLLARRFADFYRSHPDGDDAQIEVAEREALGVDHAAAGSWLFEAWQLPRAIVQAVASHHDDVSTPGLPAVVAAADVVVRFPDASILLGDVNDPHGAAARAAAAACDLTAETWSAVAAGVGGGAAARA